MRLPSRVGRVDQCARRGCREPLLLNTLPIDPGRRSRPTREWPTRALGGGGINRGVS